VLIVSTLGERPCSDCREQLGSGSFCAFPRCRPAGSLDFPAGFDFQAGSRQKESRGPSRGSL
jgi:hypothetical protein